MPAMSALERLDALNADTEIWWDSSPLVYDAWRCEVTESAPVRAPQLQRLWDTRRPTEGIIRGCTTNPPLAWQAIHADRPRWDAFARAQAREALDATDLMWRIYGEVSRQGAAMLEPLYHASMGRFGHICAQVDPRNLCDLDAMLEQAHRLHALAPNIMIKMPATSEGIEGIRLLSAEGIATTATLCFSVAQLVAVAQAAQAGFAQARAAGRDLCGTRSCAALMLGRMEDAPAFREEARRRGIDLSEADLRWAGVAIARRAYSLYRQRGYETSLLCASMRLGPNVDGQMRIWHLEQLTGGAMVLTIFPNILAAFLDLYDQRDLPPRIDEPVPETVLSRLLRITYFRQAYEQDALAPEEFVHLAGVVATGGAFAQAMSNIETYAQSHYSDSRTNA